MLTFDVVPVFVLTFDVVPVFVLTFDVVPVFVLTFDEVPVFVLTFDVVPVFVLTFDVAPVFVLTFDVCFRRDVIGFGVLDALVCNGWLSFFSSNIFFVISSCFTSTSKYTPGKEKHASANVVCCIMLTLMTNKPCGPRPDCS